MKNPVEARKKGRLRLLSLSCHARAPVKMVLSYLFPNSSEFYSNEQDLENVPYALCMITNSTHELRPQQSNPRGEDTCLLDTALERTFKIEKVPVETTLEG